jgi:hypothetical protein
MEALNGGLGPGGLGRLAITASLDPEFEVLKALKTERRSRSADSVLATSVDQTGRFVGGKLSARP